MTLAVLPMGEFDALRLKLTEAGFAPHAWRGASLLGYARLHECAPLSFVDIMLVHAADDAAAWRTVYNPGAGADPWRPRLVRCQLADDAVHVARWALTLPPPGARGEPVVPGGAEPPRPACGLPDGLASPHWVGSR